MKPPYKTEHETYDNYVYRMYLDNNIVKDEEALRNILQTLARAIDALQRNDSEDFS